MAIETENIAQVPVPAQSTAPAPDPNSLSSLEAKAAEAGGAHNANLQRVNDAMLKKQEADAALKKAKKEEKKWFGRSKKEEKAADLAYEEAKKAAEAAEKELAAAESAAEASAPGAEAAEAALAEKKAEIEAARPNDKTYVVAMGKMYCRNVAKEEDYGMRESYLSLMYSHGVLIKEIPQLVIRDRLKDYNVINFGGCNSVENPSTVLAAENAAKEAKKLAEATSFGDWLIDVFCKPKKIKVDESLIEVCMGECKPIILANWTKEKEKVTINDSPPLLRRGELICKYGGKIILETSGQPE